MRIPLLVRALATSVALVAATLPAASACDAGGLRPLLHPGRILLFGEIHGGVEGPRLVAEVACAALARDLTVTVALEIPQEEQGRLERFLGSAGTESERRDLLAGNFWIRTYQDGRSSVAMMELLDRLRRLRREGALRVVLLDAEAIPGSSQQRDDAMGRRLVEAIAAVPATAMTLALMGNVHSRTTTGVPWDAAYRPAGLQVEQRWPDRSLSLLLSAPPGQAWMCSSAEVQSCGIATLGGSVAGEAGTVELHATPRDGHEGSVRLGSATTSPPARGGG